MKKKILFILFNICILASLSAKAKNKAPAWITEEGLNKAFPKTEYIRALETSTTEQDAKNKAARAVSNFIKVQITDNLSTSLNAVQENNETVSKRREVVENISSFSDNTLYQLQYTKPYFEKKTGTYYCVAYINRNDAWKFIEPKMEKTEKLFNAEYKKALSLDDNFSKIQAIRQSQLVLADFYEVYDFARVIDVEKASKYESLDTLATSSYFKLSLLRNECRIKIEMNEQNSNVYSKIANVLNDAGYSVVKEGYTHILTVNTTGSISQSGDIYVSYPTISIVIKNGESTVFSGNKNIGKCVGFNTEGCERIVIHKLNNAIEEIFGRL